MTVISIVGASGTGKSFLVKQLGAATQSPCFFEGEEGSIPTYMLESTFKNPDPFERWEFYSARYKKNLERAHEISKLGLDVFVDGAVFSAEPILRFEDEKYHAKLRTLWQDFMYLEADKIILITMSEKKLKESFKKRNRASEQHEQAIQRALKIQNISLKLAKDNPKVTILNRTNLDFSKEEDLNKVLKVVNSFH